MRVFRESINRLPWPRLFLAIATGAIFLTSPDPVHSEEKSKGQWFRDHFSLENRITYRARSYAYGYRDADIYDHWYAEGRNLFQNRLDVYFSGRVDKDLEGHSGSFPEWEGKSSGFEGDIYQLYGDIHSEKSGLGLRFGRQYVEEADGLHLDGGVLRFGLYGGWSMRAILGRVVDEGGWFEEQWAYGLSLSGSLWKGNANRLTAVYFDRESESITRYSLDTWQRFGNARVQMGADFLDRELETTSLNLAYFPEEGNLDAFLSISYWAGLNKDVFGNAYLSKLFGAVQPYTFATARLTWRALSWLSISPYVAGRESSGEGDGGINRDYRRYGLTFTFNPHPHWTLSLTGDYWGVRSGDRFFGVTGEVEYHPSKDFWFSFGTGYLNYRYELNEGLAYASLPGDVTASDYGTITRVSPDVYSAFGRIRYKINDYLSIRLNGEIEKDTLEKDYSWSILTALVIRF
ncbi:MAG: hypothetical protein CVU57_07735 [Deltaproteobacteria bacterium HGW-Deltaproteobacteria-15]|jgi:hypothetical protein|nr:MAG: hypothetical protein CVU57_07735 [Deltaproteobacteria bacterium HGW-Deltaproteobacteria-15]